MTQIESEEFSDLFKKGEEFLKVRDTHMSLECFRKCVKFQPNNHKALHMLGELCWWVWRRDSKPKLVFESLKHFDKAIYLYSGDAEYFRCRGRSYRDIGHFKEAMKDCEKALDLNCECSIYYTDLAKCHYFLKDSQKAIEIATIGCSKIKVSPHDLYYRNSFEERGFLKMKIRDYEEAVKDFSKSIELINSESFQSKPLNGANRSYLFRGECNKKLGNFDAALEDYSKSIESSFLSQKDRFYFERGFFYVFTNNPKCLDDFSKAMELSTNESYKAKIYLFRGLYYQKVNNIELAILNVSKSIEIAQRLIIPQISLHYFKRSLLYREMKEYKLALDDINSSLFYSMPGNTIGVEKGPVENLMRILKIHKSQILKDQEDFYGRIKKGGNSETTFNEKLRLKDEQEKISYLLEEEGGVILGKISISMNSNNLKIENVPKLFFFSCWVKLTKRN